jgi:hypothetical protein
LWISIRHTILLSRKWPKNLKGYLIIDSSNLWLPWNGKPNQIKIDWDRPMKYTVTYLDEKIDLSCISKSN